MNARVLVAVVAATCFCPPASAQTFELGGSLGGSCRGSEGTMCTSSVPEFIGVAGHDFRTIDAYFGAWFADWIELSGRIARFAEPDAHVRGRPIDQTVTIEYHYAKRRRTIVQAELVWHYRQGKRIRPMTGIGLGEYVLTQIVTCEPLGCEGVPRDAGTPRLGPSRHPYGTLSFVVGVSALLHPRWRIGIGRRLHNPFGETRALSESFVTIGYRFGSTSLPFRPMR